MAEAAKPFCSQGCKDRDLLQWLSDGHRIPGPSVEEGEDMREDGLDS
ncbi:DNA gyrase inhibitor YacG [Sphingomonas sp. AP4-R1]